MPTLVILAFILRLLYIALSLGSIIACLRLRDEGTTTKTFLLSAGAVLSLWLSFALVRDLQQFSDLPLYGGLCLLIFVLGSILWAVAEKCGAAASLVAMVFLLSGTGIVLSVGIYPEGALKDFAIFGGSLAVALVVFRLADPIPKLTSYYKTLLVVSVVILATSFFGSEINGSQNWLQIGGMSVQPSSFAKVIFLVGLSGYVAANGTGLSKSYRKIGFITLPSLRLVVPFILALVFAGLILALQRDFGLVLVMVLASTILLASTVKRGWRYFLTMLFLIALFGLVAYVLVPHVQDRVNDWLNGQILVYQFEKGFQAVGAGGIFGTGFASSSVDLPVAESDFIYAVTVERMGLLGGLVIVAALICFLVVGRRVLNHDGLAPSARNIMVAGLSLIGLQALVILGGVTGLIPLTGIDLPFVVFSGSSMLSFYLLLGIMLRASTESRMADLIQEEEGVSRRTALKFLGFTSLSALAATLVIGKTAQIQSFTGIHFGGAATDERLRGSIYSADDIPLAQTVANGQASNRKFAGLAIHTVGYASNGAGITGLELWFDDILSGDDQGGVLRVLGAAPVGRNIITTIDSGVQKKAQDMLSDLKGAIVVMQASTGAVLAAASSPCYDVGNSESMGVDSAQFDRVNQGLYVPGSTFKIITLVAAIDSGLVTLNNGIASPGMTSINGDTIRNAELVDLGIITVRDAFAYSSNTAFARLATLLGADVLCGYAARLGFNLDFSSDLPIAASVMTDPDHMTAAELAWGGCGQPVGTLQEHNGPLVTPIHMAMIAGAMSNGGMLMKPYSVQRITNDTEVIHETQPVELGTGIPTDTAAAVLSAMQYAVDFGTGQDAAIDGYVVTGKTGTGETTTGENRWFVGTLDDIAISVVVETTASMNYKKANAAAIAREILLHTMNR